MPTQPDNPRRGTFVFDRGSQSVIRKPGSTPMKLEPRDLQVTYEIVLQPRADGERMNMVTRKMISHEQHEHVVHAAQDQIAEQARRIAELERENTNQVVAHLRSELERAGDMLRQTRLERKWARVNEQRAREKLEATRERLEHAKRDLAGAHVGNARSAKRIEQLRSDLQAAHERNNWTIQEQRKTLYESGATYVVHFDSSKGTTPKFDNEIVRTSALVFVMDDHTGEVWCSKARYGIPTSQEILRTKDLNKDLEATIAVLREELSIAHESIELLQDVNNSLADDLKRARSCWDSCAESLRQRDVRIDQLSADAAEYKAGFQFWKQAAERIRARELEWAKACGRADGLRIVAERQARNLALQNLGLTMTLAFERVTSGFARLADALTIFALRYQIQRNESFEMERKRLEIDRLEAQMVGAEIAIGAQSKLYWKNLDDLIGAKKSIELLTAQRDAASGRVNVQGRELVALRSEVEQQRETITALAQQSVELRKQSEWNEKRWRDSATRSDEWRAKYQALNFEPLGVTFDGYAVGDLIEVTDGIQPCSNDPDFENPPVGSRFKIISIDVDDPEAPFEIEWDGCGDGSTTNLGAHEIKRVDE